MLVAELMTARPVTVRAATTVKAALRLLDHEDITMLPVIGDRRPDLRRGERGGPDP